MGRLLLRILLRFSRKLGIKKLESFLVEYAKGRFNYLSNPPQVPEIGDVPQVLSGDKDVKSEVITKGATLVGGGVLLLTQLGNRVSDGEIKEASRDLDSATEDWNDDLLPLYSVVGQGLTSVLDTVKTAKIDLPDIELTPIPQYETLFENSTGEIKREYGDKKSKTTDRNKTEAAGFSGTVRAVRDWTTIGDTRYIPSNKFKVITRDGRTVMKRHGQEWRVQTVAMGESFDSLLEGYTYDSKRQTIGATGAFFGSESGRMRKINKIILHCTADPDGVDHTLEYYNAEHLKRDNGTWMGVGYHFIIHPNGTIDSARPVNMVGSHCKGQNYNSIGIAYIGGMNKKYTAAKDTRTRAQKRQMWRLVLFLLQRFPSATVHGHHEYDPKPCPCFDVKSEYKALMNNGFDIDALDGGYATNVEIRETSSQFGDNLKTQKGDMNVIRENAG